MSDQSHPESKEKRLILVLPKTFFDSTFLLPRDSTAFGFKVANCYHFIANLVIEVTAALPENNVMAATSKRAFDEFSRGLQKKNFIRSGKELLDVFQNMLVIVPTESMNALGDVDSMVALADRLYATSSLDPLVVVNPDSVENYRLAAATYYGKDPKRFGLVDIPFKLFDPVETKVHLQAIFRAESEEVLRRTSTPWNVF